MLPYTNGCSLPKGSLSKFFLLAAGGACLSTFSSFGNTMVECAMLGLSESFFLFDPMELFEELALSDKTVGRHTEIPWTISVAWHLSPNCEGLVYMLCSLELSGRCDIKSSNWGV